MLEALNEKPTVHESYDKDDAQDDLINELFNEFTVEAKTKDEKQK